jgi:hypothetical protein
MYRSEEAAMKEQRSCSGPWGALRPRPQEKLNRGVPELFGTAEGVP